MEGLEVSVVNLSYILSNNDIFRIDSTYFLKGFLKEEGIIRQKEYKKLKDISIDIKSFGAYSLNNEVEYITEGIPFIRGVDMKNGVVNFSNVIRISEAANKLLWKSEIKPEMVLLSMSGTIGDVAIALQEWQYPINSSQDLAKIDTGKLFNPYVLYAFLGSKLGQNYLKREARGSVQQHVFLSQIEQLEIPIFQSKFQSKIEDVVKLAHQQLKESQSLYTQAETLLLQSLGLENFTPSHEAVNVKSLKDSFLSTGRLDAEYYQKKYEEIEDKIISYSGLTRLEDVLQYVYTGEYSEVYLPKEKELKFYIRSTNIQGGQIQEDSAYFVKPDNFTKFVQKGDIVTARVGTLGVFGTINEQMAGAIYSDNVLCFRLPNNFNPDVYTLWFNSKYNWELIDKFARGSVQQRLNQETLKELIIPILPQDLQTEISTLIQKSFALKAESEQLLQLAKKAVEVAIEEGEEAAMAKVEEMILGKGGQE